MNRNGPGNGTAVVSTTGRKAQAPADRLLGATSGPHEGNVRAILAIMLAGAFVFLLGFLVVLRVFEDATYLQEIVVGGFGALVSAFTLTVGAYIGRRSAEGA